MVLRTGPNSSEVLTLPGPAKNKPARLLPRDATGWVRLPLVVGKARSTVLRSTDQVLENAQCPGTRRHRSDSTSFCPVRVARTNSAGRSNAPGKRDRVRIKVRLLRDRESAPVLLLVRANPAHTVRG